MTLPLAMFQVLGCCYTQVLDESKAVQEMAVPKGPAQYAKETQILWDRGPRDSTALPCLALAKLSAPQSAAETTSLPTSVSSLGISLAIMKDLLSGS